MNASTKSTGDSGESPAGSSPKGSSKETTENFSGSDSGIVDNASESASIESNNLNREEQPSLSDPDPTGDAAKTSGDSQKNSSKSSGSNQGAGASHAGNSSTGGSDQKNGGNDSAVSCNESGQDLTCKPAETDQAESSVSSVDEKTAKDDALTGDCADSDSICEDAGENGVEAEASLTCKDYGSDAGINETGPGNSYVAAVIPDEGVVNVGSPTAFTATFKEHDLNNRLGSAQLFIPNSFTDVEDEVVTTNGWGYQWVETDPGSEFARILSLWSVTEGNYLGFGETMSATYTATTNEIQTHLFDTKAWTTANDDHTGIYDGSDPGRTNNMYAGYNQPRVNVWVDQAAGNFREAGNNVTVGLNDIRQNLNWHYLQVNDIDLDSEPFNVNSGWEPIGAFGIPAENFSGGYNGNGYKISNLYIDRLDEDDTGLFAVIREEAIIQNVELVAVKVTGKESVGSLAGMNFGLIQDCLVEGEISGTGMIGGLVGYNTGVISGSQADVNVQGSENHCGGLIGYNYEGEIKSCSATGSVTGINNIGGLLGNNYKGIITDSSASGNVAGSGDHSGGLIGQNSSDGQVSYSFATGQVEGGNMTGGLIGSNQGIINNCSASGNISSQDMVGGLVGNNFFGAISDSHAYGNVTGKQFVGGLVGSDFLGTITSSDATGGVVGQIRVGGLVGDTVFGSITGSHAYGKVSGSISNLAQNSEIVHIGGLLGSSLGASLIDVSASGQVTLSLPGSTAAGNEETGISIRNIGGLVGFLESGSISNGSATGYVGGILGVINNVGGLVGRLESGTLNQCRAEGNVTGTASVGGLLGYAEGFTVENCCAKGDVSGNSFVGGLIGKDAGAHTNRSGNRIENCYATGDIYSSVNAAGGLIGLYDPNTVINNCYAVGAISSTGSTGGLVGEIFDLGCGAKITASFYDHQTTGQNDSGKGEPKSTEQLKQLVTFLDAGWLITGEDGSYPVLWWELEVVDLLGVPEVEQYIWHMLGSIEPEPDPIPDPGPVNLTTRRRTSTVSPFYLKESWLTRHETQQDLETDPGFLELAPEAPQATPLWFLVIPPFEPDNGDLPMVTIPFIEDGNYEQLKSVVALYELLLQEFEANQDSLSEAEYAYSLLDLAAGWAAIQVVEARLSGDEASLEEAVEAFQEVMFYLAEEESYSSHLTEEQLEALNDLLEAIAEQLEALGANL